MNYHGLANLGNTCYINTSMQLLFCIPLFNAIIDNDTSMNNVPDSILCASLHRLRNNIRNSPTNAILSPIDFIECVYKTARIKGLTSFKDKSQQDVHEFLLFILDCFHESTSKPTQMKIDGISKGLRDTLAIDCYKMIMSRYNRYSNIIHNFYGISVTSICKNDILNHVPESFSILSLPIPTNITTCNILDCFNLYCIPETIPGDEQSHQSHQSHTIPINEKYGDRVKYTRFWSIPNILIVMLNRANMTGKNNCLIVSQLIIDLSKYVIGYNQQSYVYELYGICNHLGRNTHGGHYISIIKSNNTWVRIDDESCSNIPENNLFTSDMYCLIFCKK